MRIAPLALLVLGLAAAGCRAGGEPSTPAAPAVPPAPGQGAALAVAVTVAPQRWVVEQLAGGRVAVQVLLPPGADHETFEPTIGSLSSLAGARLWFQVGPAIYTFEQAWAGRVLAAAPGIRAVDTSSGLPLLGANPHTWLSPRRVALAARTMARALSEADPAGRPVFEANLARFEQQAAALDRELAATLAPLHGRQLVVFHPAWDYLAHDYGFSFLAIERQGHEPGAAGLEQLLGEAQRAGAKDVFVEPQLASRLAATVADELGGRVVVVDPLALDWPEGLRRAARAFVGQAR